MADILLENKTLSHTTCGGKYVQASFFRSNVKVLHYTKAGRKPRGIFSPILSGNGPLDTADGHP